MIKSAIYLALTFGIHACSGQSSNTTIVLPETNQTVNSYDTTITPVESNPPNTNYKPAFSGQTRIAGVATQTAYSTTKITEKLNKPWGIDQLPDGRFIISQKGGKMVLVSQSGEISDAIEGIPDVDSKGQGGLLDVTIDPDFETTRLVFWSFSEKVSGGNHTAVASGKLNEDGKKMENVKIIYRALPTYNGDKHYGSRIVFDRNGNLFVCTGERSDLATRPQAQSLNSALGKIIRITKEGKPVEGNPFIERSDAKPEIYSYGHRNPQGLAIHPQTGDLWNSEMGPRGGDEINKVSIGKNYGWPSITYGIEYSGAKISNGATQKEGMEQPIYYWDPVLSPSGMTFYNSDVISEWKNNLFICGLSSKHISRIVLENNKVVGEERLLEKENQRFRDIFQGKDGALYAVTDGGILYRIGK